MIEPGRMLGDVRRSLRRVVLPAVADPQARAVLAAALGILDEVAARVRADQRPAEETVADLLPRLPEWAEALRGDAPDAASFVAERAELASAATSGAEARVIALAAAERVAETAWMELAPERRDECLAVLRPLLRADVERQKGTT